MLNLVFRYKILTTHSPINAGQYIQVFWNDSTELFEVYEYDDGIDTTGTLMGSGPDIGAQRFDWDVFNVTGRPQSSIYRFCDGTQLNYFTPKSLFPYANQIQVDNHVSCSLAVCDLTFSGYESTDASDNVTEDGTVTVFATSSHGVIKYSLDPEFDYASQGQSSNAFLGLLAGDYTVYAKDEIGCSAQIQVRVQVPSFWGPKYRLDYTDVMNGKDTRIDILERGYEGEPIEVCGGADPFVLRYNGADLNKFKPVIASEARLTLISESNFYFLDIFTQDERKYKMAYYKDLGNMVPGFIPAVLDDIEDWPQTSFPDNPPFIDYDSWVGENVSVHSNNLSQNKYTLYAFESGREYSFDYNFLVTSGTYPAKAYRNIEIRATNSSYSNLGVTKSIIVGSNGTKSGNWTFIAPTGADRISIKITHGTVTTTTYELISFDNLTLPGDEVPAGLEIKWIGFVIGNNYKEAYKAPPYEVTIVATDGLADLKQSDFVDEFGDKFPDDIITMDAIKEMLRKTDLNLNIVTAINRIEESMSSNAVKESKFNPKTFYDDDGEVQDAFFATEHIIKPFACRLYQRNAKWFIQTVEEAVAPFLAQEFNPEGEFIESYTITDFLEIEYRAVAMESAYVNRDQVLEIIPSYGKFFFEHTLEAFASLVKSYSFEVEDVYPNAEGLATFRNWTVNIENAPGADYGIKRTKAFEGDYNFFYHVQLPPYTGEPITSSNRFLKLLSSEGLVEYGESDLFEYRFSYAVILAASGNTNAKQPLWVRMRWYLRVGDLYYNAISSGWVSTPQYNEEYVDSYNKSQEFKIVAPMPTTEDIVTEDFQVEFQFYDERNFAFEETTSVTTQLEAIPTVSLDPGYRVKGKYTYTNGLNSYEKYLYWELVSGNDDADGYDVVTPDDHDDEDNPKLWILQDEVLNRRSGQRGTILEVQPRPELKVTYWYLDNVVLRLLPNGEEPAENITIERTNNVNIKVNYEDQFLLNDIDIDNINNSERTYKNFFKKLDGSPTQLWTRTYRLGSGKLLDLYSADFVSQYKRRGFKLTGSLLVKQDVNYGTVLVEVLDGGKKYMFMGFELHDKGNQLVFDLSELKDLVTSPTPPDESAGFSIGFSTGFRA